ncbi:hypothetical protein [Mycobacterium sp.]|uniref:hypothetical protein n=1 Tax=Mycobacterium sp. TaxID=1785 RepID=UPI002BC06E81|nr:hypothetical protein [Mycobacterium sp.]HKP41850.1 hypothetical protein [Mycobacterium sp.]
MIRTAAVAAVAVLATGCTDEPIVNTGEPPAATPTSASTPGPPVSNAHLVDAFDYVGHMSETTGYYFTTPSGKWRCAILTRTKAGCQAASNWQSGLGVRGEPDSANALVVESQGEPQFATLQQPEFSLVPGPANVLPFNRILAAAGFRCNVQESGVSCLSETSGSGFTFSAQGYTPQYTDVPANAP